MQERGNMFQPRQLIQLPDNYLPLRNLRRNRRRYVRLSRRLRGNLFGDAHLG